MDVQVGDVIQTKKPHPCGANRFDVLRVGMDFKIKCQGCGHEIMLPRAKIERNIKKSSARGGAVAGLHRRGSIPGRMLASTREMNGVVMLTGEQGSPLHPLCKGDPHAVFLPNLRGRAPL